MVHKSGLSSCSFAIATLRAAPGVFTPYQMHQCINASEAEAFAFCFFEKSAMDGGLIFAVMEDG
jgi:hypothetical protein